MRIANSIRFPGMTNNGGGAASFAADLVITAPQLASDSTEMTCTAAGVYNGKTYEAKGTNGSATIKIKESGTYDIKGTIDSVGSSPTKQILFGDNGREINTDLNFCILKVNTSVDCTITLTSGEQTLTKTSVNNVAIFYLPSTGVWSVHANDGNQDINQDISCLEYQNYETTLLFRGAIVEAHNATYRGEDLKSTAHFGSIANLYTAVSTGNFDDIYVGDYITYNSMKYIVMGVDFYKGKGVVEDEKFHLVFMPENCMGKAKMNSTATNTTGYANSVMHKTTLPGSSYLGVMNKAFENHILNGTWTLTTDNNGAMARNTCKIRLANAMAVNGGGLLSKANEYGEMDTILPAIKLNENLSIKKYSSSKTWWWLSDVMDYASSTEFCTHTSGIAGTGNTNTSWLATQSYGVAPLVLFG